MSSSFSLSATEGQEIVASVAEILQAKRNDESFDKWDEFLLGKKKNNKLLKRYLYHACQKCLDDIILLIVIITMTQNSFLDFVVVSIQERFNQLHYQTYVKLQNLITKSCKNENISEEWKRLESLFKHYFNFLTLKSQLKMIPPFAN